MVAKEEEMHEILERLRDSERRRAARQLADFVPKLGGAAACLERAADDANSHKLQAVVDTLQGLYEELSGAPMPAHIDRCQGPGLCLGSDECDGH